MWDCLSNINDECDKPQFPLDEVLWSRILWIRGYVSTLGGQGFKIQTKFLYN